MTIYTERTICKPIVKEDFSNLIDMYLEPDSNKYIEPFRGKTSRYFYYFLNKKLVQNKISIEFWIVRSKNTNEILGTINLNKVEAIGHHHLGCHLKRKHWNQGYASELLIKFIQYGFDEKGLEKIYGLVDKNNLVSKKIFKKGGLRYQYNKRILNSMVEVHCIENQQKK
tara:strand:- start:1601 stop:2107 length:507 start_codon:yes stop_codon:yes gene_type:complete